MDKETLNEVTERQKKMFAAQNSLQNMDIGGCGGFFYFGARL